MFEVQHASICSDCFVASAPMDYGTRKAASSATGYIGAAVTGILSGWLTDAWGWDAAFFVDCCFGRCFDAATVESYYFMSRRRGKYE